MQALLDPLRDIALAAGRAVAEVYAGDFAVRGKADASPVTAADERAEAIIVPALQRLVPGLPVVAEEAVAARGVPACGACFWLVDPLDGTREFVGRNGEFTVNIALVEDGRPVLGVVHAPALAALWLGAAGLGAWEERGAHGRRSIRCRPVPPEGATVLASRSHGDAEALARWLAGRRVAAVRPVGSSLKLAELAAGEGDVYPRFGRTMGWDIAAGHAVLAAAGGDVLALDGQPLRYAPPFENPPFVAGSAEGLAWAARDP